MKYSSLYRPLLWMRKIIIYLLITAIVMGLALYFIVNSAFVVRKVADTFAPDYNISYSRIHGNVLTGVKIEDLAYNRDPLAKHLTLKWNPAGLFKKTIIVNTLQIEKANVDTIKTLIASLSSAENNQSNENSTAESLGIDISVHHASLSLEPFSEQGIGISNVILDVKDVLYSSDSMDVRALALQVDSNVTKITLKAGLKDGDLHVRELTIKEVDTLALQALFVPDSNESNKSDVVVTQEENTGKDRPVIPWMPKWVHLDKVKINTLPFVYGPVDSKAFNVSGRDAVFDVEKLLLQKADLNVHSSTNLSDIYYKTKVKNNKLIGKVDFKPKKALFKLYDLPIRREAVGDIFVDLNVSRSMVSSDLKIKMEQVLKAGINDFNLDINHLHVHASYDIEKNTLQSKSDLVLTTPYAKDVLVTNFFTMDKQISYSGEIQADQFTGIDQKFVKPLHHLRVRYKGDGQSIKTEIEADNLQGTFISPDFKKATLHLENKQPLLLNEFIALPSELNQTKANIVIDAPISFENNSSLMAYAKIDSNMVNIDANISFKERLQVKTVTHIPKESLLRTYNRSVKWDHLDPVKSDIELLGKRVETVVTAGSVKANAVYDMNSTHVEGTVTLGGLHASVNGMPQEKITVETKITSLNALIESVERVYTLGDIPVLKGSGELSVILSEMKTIDIALRSPQISYQPDHKTEHIVNDIDLAVNLQDEKIVLNRYALTYGGQKLYSTKPSTIFLNDQNVTMEPIWLNDELKVVGTYDLKARKGTIEAEADILHIVHEIVDLESDIDIKTVLDGNKTSVNGEITLLGGHIHYDLGQKTYASDSDIIIVQDIKEKKTSPFMDGLSTSVQIKTKKPLIYKKGNVDIKAAVDLSLYKAEESELMLLGSVEILKGGSYTFEGKKFILDKSYVHFTGNPNKPLLEASVTYQSLNHLITIRITGSADMPNIHFTSKPSLTKEQILSIILFDSEAGAGTNSGEDMMKMMGGAMAKSALSDLGVQLDHLVLGEGKSIEVGKKLTNKITIIYVNDEVSSVKLKYEHGKRTESVIGVSEESQSYDILYKRDF
ncbi:translocation/assembly module TamB [Sulfurovum sp. XGS-02]|uniref:translocation/assembly module TamB domain-containing protein n=1 Tax=Sulfurovum sp. XGS-02 TaxID=2925411 RepID=UPI0020688C49|nr:translocation/assembly module TamB domain-containing protein [Sulfurovum sp. XGS-02]UPT76839.1 translocation/assembly module TamB [Sulfurovum sp. XGS-02]